MLYAQIPNAKAGFSSSTPIQTHKQACGERQGPSQTTAATHHPRNLSARLAGRLPLAPGMMPMLWDVDQALTQGAPVWFPQGHRYPLSCSRAFHHLLQVLGPLWGDMAGNFLC